MRSNACKPRDESSSTRNLSHPRDILEHMFDPRDITIDELEIRLLAHERMIARHRAAQIELVQELDQAQVAGGDGCRTLVEWVSGRLDVEPATALALVTTARSVEADDPITTRLTAGDTSFDRAAATVRLRSSGADPSLVEASTGYDLTGVRRLISRLVRRLPQTEIGAFESRHLIIQPSLDESEWRFWGRLPSYDGRIVEKALLAEADSLPREPDLPRSSRAARTADALTSVCARSLANSSTGIGDRVGPVLTLHVDAHRFAKTAGTAGIEVQNGPAAGLSLLEEVLCTGSVELLATSLEGKPLDLGRSTRVVKPRLRRHVLHRDGGCTASGCTSRYRLQPHHIIPWSEGGTTDADNLTTLCWFHHHVIVHGRGFAIDPMSPPHQRRFVRHGHRDPP